MAAGNKVFNLQMNPSVSAKQDAKCVEEDNFTLIDYKKV